MHKPMNRRDFLKYALTASAAMGICPVVSYAALEKMSPYRKGVQKHVTGCMWCQNGCSMIVHIKDGRAVHVTGNPDDPLTKGMICIKPLGSLELLYSPFRHTYPLKRLGSRGDNARFIRLSWEEALDEISEKLRSIRDLHGGESLGIWASGRSAADGRYLNKAFAKLYGTPNYEKTGPFCNYSGKPAGISVVGTRSTPWTYSDDDFFDADLYILAGSNMAATRPVSFSRIKERRRKGECRVIVIDPRYSESCKDTDLWLPIRAGTDMALVLTMISYILKENIYDMDYVRRYSVGFDVLKSRILSLKYDLEWGAAKTGITQSQIRQLAETYAHTKKAIIVGNAGLSHHTNAVQTHRAFYFLAALTGHFGERAMGYSCLNNGGTSIGSLEVPIDRIPKTKIGLSKNPVGWLESLENNTYPYKLRALISTGSPLTQWPNQGRIRDLIGRLDLSVFNGLTLNINAYHFDYILPAATWIESGGLSPVSDDSRFVWTPQLIEPPGLARPDRWWWIELGKRMGWNDIFREELKDPATLQDLVGIQKGYTVKNFMSKKDNSLRAPISLRNGKIYERETLFLDKNFFTPSKKIEFWTENLEASFNEYGLTAIPEFYIDPDIAQTQDITIFHEKGALIPSPYQGKKTLTFKVLGVTGKAGDQAYPLCLITGRPSWAIMGHTTHWIKKLNDISPDQICMINARTARSMEIRDGEMIRVASPYGEAPAKAKLTNSIRKDTVFIPYSFGEKSPFTEWKSVNFLTNMEARCPVSGQVTFKGVPVRIMKTG